MLTFPPEWHPQDAIQLTWPHDNTDWSPIFEDVERCFVSIAEEVTKRQRLILISHEIDRLKERLSHTKICWERVMATYGLSNDTWARDYGGITRLNSGHLEILDFDFNGWGRKYAFEKDNLLTRTLFDQKVFDQTVMRVDRSGFILEGGAIESNGKGQLLVTESCLLNKTRNSHLNKSQIQESLMSDLGLDDVLWLKNGHLDGDDTDGHVDTLARFCDEKTIAYVKCSDILDPCYEGLAAMEKELRSFASRFGWELVPLPMASPKFHENRRLPATYANFLIINEAVLFPTYRSPIDDFALNIAESLFPNREVVPIDCSILIKQNGSLHCTTMQYPQGTLSRQ